MMRFMHARIAHDSLQRLGRLADRAEDIVGKMRRSKGADHSNGWRVKPIGQPKEATEAQREGLD